MAETLRGSLSNTANELNKLLLKAISDEEKTTIRKLHRIYMNLWEETLLNELQANDPGFQDALAELEKARKAAVEAQGDIQKISEAINKAVAAAKVVDKVVQTGMDLLS